MTAQTDSHADKQIMTGHLAQLSNNVHSNSESEVRDALKELAELGNNDAARALIDAYRDCHWRDTRMSILRALGRNGSQRAVEFLLRTANEHFPSGQSDSKDIGLCQETLLALGDTHDPLAASYLLHRLEGSPAYLKAWIVNALSRIPDLRAAPFLHRLMDSQESTEHPQLLRNIVVALSEMKDTSSLSKLIEMLKARCQNSSFSPDATSLTLLAAIARLSRQASDIQQFERNFEGEMLHQQFYQQCLTQVNFRQQWTLEDYLGKIFFSEKIHRSLPLELNSFPTQDVIEALSIFTSEEKHFPRLCATLGSTLQSEQLIEKFIQPESLNAAQLLHVLNNLAYQRGPVVSSLCEKFAQLQIKNLWQSAETQPLVAAWLQLLICTHEQPLESLLSMMISPLFSTAHERQKIEFINAFVGCALVYRTEQTWPKKQLQIITELIQTETSTLVLGRWLRALGEIGLGDLKWNEELRTRVHQTSALHGSAMLMLENEESHQNGVLLKTLQSTLQNNPDNTALFLRACATLKTPEKDLPAENILTAALSSDKNEDRLSALNYLSHHPRLSCLDAVLAHCVPEQSKTRMSAAAIVAARAYRHQKSIQPLEKCLQSSSKVISGRALDALLYVEHPQANEVVIHYLINHLNNPVICDKVLRSLKATAEGQADLAAALEQATAHTGNAALREDILDLAARLRTGSSDTAAALPAADAIREIDKQLESKIVDYLRLADPVKASLRSAELPLNQPELFEKTVDKSSSVVQYCKALDLTLEKEFGQKILFPKLENQLHVFQNILHQAELDNESPNLNLVLRHFRAEHVFDLNTLPASKMTMIARSILNGRILRERTQVIDGLKAWAVLLLMFSGHERLWGRELAKKDPLAFPMLAHKLVVLQDLRNPAAHRQTMLALAPLSEIRKEVFQVFALMKKAFE